MDSIVNHALNRQANAASADQAVATARWATDESILQMRHDPEQTILLGFIGDTLRADGGYVGYSDDKHMVTVAGSRAGKGRSAIIPALLDYRGSAFVLDPKGENANLTAVRRGDGSETVFGLGQKVRVLDPFGVTEGCEQYLGAFNPLDFLPDDDTAIYQAFAMAEVFVLVDANGDSHWDESAKAVIQAFILHVKSWKFFRPEQRTLPFVRQLLMEGDVEGKARIVAKLERDLEAARLELETADRSELSEDELAELQEDIEKAETSLENAINRPASSFLMSAMKRNDAYGGFVREWATAFEDVPTGEKGSILSSAKRHLAFLAGEAMERVLSSEKADFDLKELRTAPNGLTVYLCLPAKFLNSHGRWLRAMLSQTLNAFEDLGPAPPDARRTLFVLDEFASLGHINLLEKAAGLMAGYGVKLWFILQDLTQLKRHYKESWETFIGNAGVLQFFGISDKTTCDYVSAKLGKIEIEREVITTSETQNTSQSNTQGINKSTSTGASQGFNPALEAEQRARRAFVDTGSSSGQSEGFNQGSTDTSGSSTSTSRAANYTQANLLNPDEVALVTERSQQTQILFIDGKRPMKINRVNYDQSIIFEGKRTSTILPLEKLRADHQHWACEKWSYNPAAELPDIPEEIPKRLIEASEETRTQLKASRELLKPLRDQERRSDKRISWLTIAMTFAILYLIVSYSPNGAKAWWAALPLAFIFWLICIVIKEKYYSWRRNKINAKTAELEITQRDERAQIRALNESEEPARKERAAILRQHRDQEYRRNEARGYLRRTPFVWKENGFSEAAEESLPSLAETISFSSKSSL